MAKKGPGRPARKPTMDAARFERVVAQPSDERYAFEFVLTEPLKLEAVFNIFHKNGCGCAHMIIGPDRLTFVSRESPNHLRGEFNCNEIFRYYADPEIQKSYLVRLEEDSIISFVCNGVKHETTSMLIRRSDLRNLEIVMVAGDLASPICRSRRIAAIVPEAPMPGVLESFNNLGGLLFSMVFDYDHMKKLVSTIKNSESGIEFYKCVGEPMTLRWKDSASHAMTLHEFDSRQIQLVENSTDRINCFEVSIDSLKRFFTTIKVNIPSLSVSIYSGDTVLLRNDLEPASIQMIPKPPSSREVRASITGRGPSLYS